MGLFKLGSTVIILHAPNAVNWNESLTPATDVKMGSRIGLINTTR